MRKSRLSWAKQNQLIELFVAGSTARTAATLVDVNKSTASYYFQRLRQLVCSHSQHYEVVAGEIKIDENYFGYRCDRCDYCDYCDYCESPKEKQGHGTGDKLTVFVLLKGDGSIFTIMAPDTKANTLLPIIREKIKIGSIVSNGTWRNYNDIDVPGSKPPQINGLDNFWNQVKHHMRKFNGISKKQFHVFVKECEWRFNNNDPKVLLKQLNQWVQHSIC